jgi:hypothetical protein
MPYSSEHLARLVQDEHTGQVIDLEHRVASASFGNGETLFAQLIRRTLAAWTRAFGGPDQPAMPGDLLRRILAAARAAIRRILDGVTPQADTALNDSIGEALALGVRQGGEFLRAARGRGRTVSALRPSRRLLGEARRLGDLITQRRDRALQLLQPDRITRWTHLLTGIGAGHATFSAIRAHVAWVVNTAVNEGLDAVIRASAKVRLWVSEADACVRCLAYTGRTAPIDEPFPGGLSWDPRQRHIGAEGIDGPPLHANCRCRTVPWNDAWTTSGVPFPLALQREAHRSLGYGTARPSESRAARLRAARELLRTEPDLLPAVEARARAALRTGRFTQAA